MIIPGFYTGYFHKEAQTPTLEEVQKALTEEGYNPEQATSLAPGVLQEVAEAWSKQVIAPFTGTPEARLATGLTAAGAGGAALGGIVGGWRGAALGGVVGTALAAIARYFFKDSWDQAFSWLENSLRQGTAAEDITNAIARLPEPVQQQLNPEGNAIEAIQAEIPRLAQEVVKEVEEKYIQPVMEKAKELAEPITGLPETIPTAVEAVQSGVRGELAERISKRLLEERQPRIQAAQEERAKAEAAPAPAAAPAAVPPAVPAPAALAPVPAAPAPAPPTAAAPAPRSAPALVAARQVPGGMEVMRQRLLQQRSQRAEETVRKTREAAVRRRESQGKLIQKARETGQMEPLRRMLRERSAAR